MGSTVEETVKEQQADPVSHNLAAVDGRRRQMLLKCPPHG